MPQRRFSWHPAHRRDYADWHSALCAVIHGLLCVPTPSATQFVLRAHPRLHRQVLCGGYGTREHARCARNGEPTPRCSPWDCTDACSRRKDDGSRIDVDASAVAGIYQAGVEIFPDMGHVMMLEPGWQAVAERIDSWLTARGL